MGQLGVGWVGGAAERGVGGWGSWEWGGWVGQLREGWVGGAAERGVGGAAEREVGGWGS